MSIVLALDATSRDASMAVRRSARTLAEMLVPAPDGFAHLLFFKVAELLEQANVRLEEVDLFAAAAGPGSFTGVRVGLTAVKGLAESLNKPVAPVSTLRAMAAAGESSRRAVLMDARRNEIFGAVYDNELRVISPDVALPLTDWLRTLPPDTCEIVAFDPAPFVNVATGLLRRPVTWRVAPRSLAVSIAICAEQDLRRGRVASALTADANYVRRPDAEAFPRHS